MASSRYSEASRSHDCGVSTVKLTLHLVVLQRLGPRDRQTNRCAVRVLAAALVSSSVFLTRLEAIGQTVLYRERDPFKRPNGSCFWKHSV